MFALLEYTIILVDDEYHLYFSLNTSIDLLDVGPVVLVHQEQRNTLIHFYMLQSIILVA
jgi:hypothetical protein